MEEYNIYFVIAYSFTLVFISGFMFDFFLLLLILKDILPRIIDEPYLHIVINTIDQLRVVNRHLYIR